MELRKSYLKLSILFEVILWYDLNVLLTY